MARTHIREHGRLVRKKRVRRGVRGTDSRPRLSVYRSSKHLYAQVISDQSGQTLLTASTLSSDFDDTKKTTNVDAAKTVGTMIARKCQERGIERVIFDRNGFLYHGRIRAVAEAAREAGLQF